MKKKHPRHMKLVKGLVKHEGDKLKAYQEAYPNQSMSTVKANAYNLFKERPEFEEDAHKVMRSALYREGATPQKIAKNIQRILESGGKEVIHPRTGEVVRLENDDVKLKAIKQACDVILGEKVQDLNSLSLTQINISDSSTPKLDAILTDLSRMSSKLGISDDVQDGEIVDVEAEATDGHDT